jgi:hypothetical protein
MSCGYPISSPSPVPPGDDPFFGVAEIFVRGLEEVEGIDLFIDKFRKTEDHVFFTIRSLHRKTDSFRDTFSPDDLVHDALSDAPPYIIWA